MPYVCTKCEEEVDIDPVGEKIICPHCSGRSVLKKRSDEAKHVTAR